MARPSFSDSERAFLQQTARLRVTTYDGNTWEYFDCGKSSGKEENLLPPLVCLPGTTGSARCFHRQITELTSKGYRVIAVQHPEVWTHEAWVHSFDRFLDSIGVQRVHIYGVSLGAYLAQRYIAVYPHRVLSLVMTQGFCDTRLFSSNTPWIKMLAYMPEFYLKKYMLEQFPMQQSRNPARVEAADYMADQVVQLKQQEAASRLTLNCLPCDPSTWNKLGFPDNKITFIESYEGISLPDQLREGLWKRYPKAKKALIKDAGDFPFLSHHEEVNMHLQVHLRAHGAFAG